MFCKVLLPLRGLKTAKMCQKMPTLAFFAIFRPLIGKIFQTWILIGWLPITLFQMLNFHQLLPFLNWLFPLLLVPQEFPTRFFDKNFLQDFPELDPDWLAPHHPIPIAKFPPITAFLKSPFPLLLVPQDFPQDFPARFSHKNFLQDFPARFSRAGS